MKNIVDAASHANIIPWHHINWRQANKSVNRLQSRIVKALQEGEHRKVRALQYLLTRSLAASALAVRRVTENTGKRTPGVDQQIWRTNKDKAIAVSKVRRGQYRAKPLRRIYIPKPGKTEKRPLSIPCMDDRAKQALHLLALDPVAEYYADQNSYGFRKKRSTADAIAACHIYLSQKRAPKWVLEGDIRGCFDNISHEWLEKWIPMNKRVLKQWLKAGYIENKILNRTERGTPQGGLCSPTLANLTLDGLEQQLKLQFKNQLVRLVKYADDFIITGNSKELLENKVKPSVEQFLSVRGLTLSKEKTRITHIEEGFDFLGFNLRKYNEKLIIKPAKSNVKEVRAKIKEIIKKSGHLRNADLIWQLNPVIRGWANYYRHACSSKVFSHLDHYMWRELWQRERKKHGKKSNKWITEKYFKATSNNQRNFYGITRQGKEVRLQKFKEVTIERHVKVRKEANPYDPAFADYFKKRQKKSHSQLVYSELTRKLWVKQKGICPLCKEDITKQTGWHQHHITHRRDGGKNTLMNLVLIHPICHEHWHQRYNESNTGLSKKVFEKA